MFPTNTLSILVKLEDASSEISMAHCAPYSNNDACALSLIVAIIEQE